MFKYFTSVFLALVLCVSPAYAGQKSAVRAGFTPDMLKGEKILFFRPSVWVGARSTAGIPEPNADWTNEARRLMVSELSTRYSDFDTQLVFEPDLVGDDAALISGYKSLFEVVARSAMMYQFFKGNRLPTKKKNPFEWGLGDGTKRISELTGARYGLFVMTRDEYGSTGRKIFQILLAGLAGVWIEAGKHQGYAGLVDLQTGQLVWLNADGEMGGDVRKPDGMKKRVGELLKGFPGLKKGK